MLTFVPLSTEKDNGHIGESVFALSFRRNLTVSTNARMTTAPSLVLACVFYADDTSRGIVSVCLHLGFVRTSSEIDESAPHFLFINIRLWS